MSTDLWYSRCCIADSECSGVIQWHHHFNYAGKRTDDTFGILPVCEFHHRHESRHDIKEKLDAITKSRMTEEDKLKYPKKVW